MKGILFLVGVASLAAIASDAQAQGAPTRSPPVIVLRQADRTPPPSSMVIPADGISHEVRPDGTRVERRVRVIREGAGAPPPSPMAEGAWRGGEWRGDSAPSRTGRWVDGRWVEGQWDGGWDRDRRVYEGEYRGTYVRDGRVHDGGRYPAPHGSRVYRDGYGYGYEGAPVGYGYPGGYAVEGYTEVVTQGAPVVVEETETTYETVRQPVVRRARVAPRATVRVHRPATARRAPTRPRCICR